MADEEKQPVHLLIEKSLLKRLDDFRFKGPLRIPHGCDRMAHEGGARCEACTEGGVMAKFVLKRPLKFEGSFCRVVIANGVEYYAYRREIDIALDQKQTAEQRGEDR